MNTEQQAIQQRLDTIERLILITAGELRVRQIRGSKQDIYVEDKLGEMMNEVLELKKLLGVPSNLSIVGKDEQV